MCDYFMKTIFVTGGVCSGLGKGITAASIGTILKAMGKKVFVMKFDPYLNVDPGTMNPFQHGEVFVTDDGAETDLDLGHYERFIDEPLTKLSNATTGQIYQRILECERNGDFLGKTIQIIPHITNAIKKHIVHAAQTSGADFLIVEIGGTVGDIEAEPYLEAARQYNRENGNENVIFVHVTLLPYLEVTHELKSKPTQSSVRELQRRGIQPDIIIARADYPISNELLEKIAMFCDVDPDAVIPAETVKTIYQVPLLFEERNVSRILSRKMSFTYKKPQLTQLLKLVEFMLKKDSDPLKIAMVGKYTNHGDAYISVHEAIKSASFANRRHVEVMALDSEKLEKQDKAEWERLHSAQGILVPGGFGSRGIEGKILAAQYAREHRLPYLGLCLGMQIATIEFARNVAKLKDATSEEFNPKSKHQVIHFMKDQKKIRQKGGTMRLGAYPCVLSPDTHSKKAYGESFISERHRHRYEFNNKYRDLFVSKGLVIAGASPDKRIVEIIELKDHPFFVGVQFHPEFKSRPLAPHPLFKSFIASCITLSKS